MNRISCSVRFLEGCWAHHDVYKLLSLNDLITSRTSINPVDKCANDFVREFRVHCDFIGHYHFP